MIAYVKGVLSEKHDGVVFVETEGVGYSLLVSQNTDSSLSVGEPAKLYVYEQIREDTHEFYGFITYADKQFFEKLLSVNGVGPRMALSIVNLGGVDDIKHAIATENVAFLIRASGVGRRLAERLVVDLKDTFAEAALLGKVSAGQTVENDALQALLGLGYNQAEAVQALANVEGETTEERIRQALTRLSNR
jgi:Holliday junction DNA helicase RuvA